MLKLNTVDSLNLSFVPLQTEKTLKAEYFIYLKCCIV